MYENQWRYFDIMYENQLRYFDILFLHVIVILYCKLLFFIQKTKKKKEKKAKKEKKEKRDKKKLLRADYEVAEGITTPSKEQVSPSQMDTPMNVQFPVSIFWSFFSLCVLML